MDCSDRVVKRQKGLSHRTHSKRILTSPNANLKENDDTVEFEEETENSEETTVTNTSRLSSQWLSEEQLKEHYEICIRMAVENKINMKNAFSLKLIDLLKHSFHLHNPGKLNFSAAASALDAGCKIYSCRVDNIYSQTVKLANEIIRFKGATGTEVKAVNEHDTCRGSIEYNRRSKKREILSSKIKLQRIASPKKLLSIKELQCDNLMSMFPLLRPSEGIVLGESRPFWPQLGNIETSKSFVLMDLKKYAHKKYLCKRKETSKVDTSSKCNQNFDCVLHQTSRAVTHSGGNGSREQNDGDGQEAGVHNGTSPHQSRLSPRFFDNNITSDSEEDEEYHCEKNPLPLRVQGKNLLLNDKTVSEYHHLDTKKLSLMRMPEFWLYPKSSCDDTCIKAETNASIAFGKRIPREIEYHYSHLVERSFKKKWKLSKSCQFKKWKDTDLLLANMKLCQNNFKKLFCCQLVMKEPKPYQETSVEDIGSDGSNTSDEQESSMEIHGDVCSELTGGFEDEFSGTSKNVNLAKASNSQTCILGDEVGSEDQESSPDEGMLVGSNLVPAPRTMVLPGTNHHVFQFKNVDIKKLKGIILSKIKEKTRKEERMMFRQLWLEVQDQLSEAVSWQMAMVCILHLASEENLCLTQAGLSDFLIHQQ